MGKPPLYESSRRELYVWKPLYKIEYAAIASLGLETILKVIVGNTYIGIYNIVLHKSGLNCLKQLENLYNHY